MTAEAGPEAAAPAAVLPALPTDPEAIFIIGVPRSGTTMMREVLERSPRIAIARENHFVGHVREREGARFYFRRAGDLSSDATITRIVEMIYGGEFQRMSRLRELSTYWKWLVANVPRDDMESRLLSAERTERGMMAAFMRVYADSRGRPIMGEKTPAHLAYVDTLLAWFPNARVVHMLRDPRAVYVSDLRRRRQHPRRPYSWLMKLPVLLQTVLLVQTIVTWRGAAHRHEAYIRRYPDRYRLVRFEDVLAKPDETLSGLFAFLGVEEPADAQDVNVVSHGFRRGEHGLDTEAVDRWRTHIHPLPRRLLNMFVGGPMQRFGYQR
jgi:hypothetical protein